MQPRQKPNFIIQFMELFDCPGADGRSKSNIYLRAVLWKYQSIVIRQGPPVVKPECISDIVFSPIRLDCRSAIYNSYRNLHSNPPDDAVLVVQVFHATSDTPKPEMDTLLGKTEIPMAYLQTEDAFTHPIIPIRSTDRATCLNFSVRLRRVFLSSQPPKRKTFFLVRHGQSKWNLAQSRINIAGMLDRDHALTELGIQQAQQLNNRWRFHFYKEGEKFAPETGAQKGNLSAYNTKNSTPMKGSNSLSSSPTPPSNIADLLDLASFESNLPSVPTKSAATASGFPDDPFADVDSFPPAVPNTTSVATTASSTMSAPVPSTFRTDLWSKDDLRQHLMKLNSTMEDTPDDYRPSTYDDSESSDDESNEKEDAFAPRHNLADEFSSGIPIPQTDKTELAEKFNHADVKLLDEQSGQVDQTLVEQRRQEYMKLFLHADAIFSSPLTRALQTAVLTMHGHPATKTYGITLYSLIREVKRMGGLDTVGIAYGEAIEHRLRSELASILGAEDADRLVTFPIEVNDANQPWWTPMADHETEQQQQDRVREFLTFLRHCDAQIPVFVGHSLFFRAFYSKRVSSHLLKNRRKLSENLKKFLLSNATMLAVTVNFTEYSMGGGLSEAVMVDADIIFGGGFHGADHDVENGAESRGTSKRSAHRHNHRPSAKDNLSGFISGFSQKAVSSLSSNGNHGTSTGSGGSGNNKNKTSASGGTTSMASSVGSNNGNDLFGFFNNETQKQLQKDMETSRIAASNTMKKWSSAMKDFLES